jgi:ribosomal protein L37AE/L43A
MEYPASTAYIAAAVKEQDIVKEPRCPTCKRMQAEWVLVGAFKCPECKTRFIIGSGFVTVLT